MLRVGSYVNKHDYAQISNSSSFVIISNVTRIDRECLN